MGCNFRVGQKVCCIENDWEIVRRGDTSNETDPLVGSVYTIARILSHSSGAFLVLSEIGDDIGFAADGFRPVVDRKTDISQFKAMLNYQPKVVVIS